MYYIHVNVYGRILSWKTILYVNRTQSFLRYAGKTNFRSRTHIILLRTRIVTYKLISSLARAVCILYTSENQKIIHNNIIFATVFRRLQETNKKLLLVIETMPIISPSRCVCVCVCDIECWLKLLLPPPSFAKWKWKKTHTSMGACISCDQSNSTLQGCVMRVVCCFR